MDCIALLDSYINRRNKYYWVIEGDIRGAFDAINHEILLALVNERIADRRILQLLERFLKAGVMEQGLFTKTELGTPQGSVVSPLLANIYLHQLDLYWWDHYGSLGKKQKERRRQEGKGNCALLRYADDWLLLTNGGKAEAYRSLHRGCGHRNYAARNTDPRSRLDGQRRQSGMARTQRRGVSAIWGKMR